MKKWTRELKAKDFTLTPTTEKKKRYLSLSGWRASSLAVTRHGSNIPRGSSSNVHKFGVIDGVSREGLFVFSISFATRKGEDSASLLPPYSSSFLETVLNQSTRTIMMKLWQRLCILACLAVWVQAGKFVRQVIHAANKEAKPTTDQSFNPQFLFLMYAKIYNFFFIWLIFFVNDRRRTLRDLRECD